MRGSFGVKIRTAADAAVYSPRAGMFRIFLVPKRGQKCLFPACGDVSSEKDVLEKCVELVPRVRPDVTYIVIDNQSGACPRL